MIADLKAEPLKLQDEVSLDEIVDLQLTALERLPSHQSQRRRSTWLVPVSCAVFAAAVTDGSAWVRLVVAGVIGVALLWLYPKYYRSFMRRYTRRHFVDALGGTGPYEVSYVLNDIGIEVDQHSHCLRFNWSDCQEVEESPDAMVLHFPNSGLVRLANRAFANDGLRQDFLRSLRSHLAAV